MKFKRTKSEKQLKAFLKSKKEGNFVMRLKLQGQGDARTIVSAPINLCTITINNSEYFFGGISESFYDKMVDKYHEKYESEKYARKDSKTGLGINEGYCFGDGDFYCENRKDAKEYAKSLGYDTLEEAYNDKAYYWTDWEVDEDEPIYNRNGDIIN